MRGPTTNHDEIRQWAETHGAKPAEVFPRVFDSEPALLRFVFGEIPKEDAKLITWESFFAHFDLLGLALVYDGPDPQNYELLQIEDKSSYRFEGKPI